MVFLKLHIHVILFVLFIPALAFAGNEIDGEVSLATEFSPFDLIVAQVRIINCTDHDVALAKNITYGKYYQGTGLWAELKDVNRGEKYRKSFPFHKDYPCSFFVLPSGMSISFLVFINDIDGFKKRLTKSVNLLPTYYQLQIKLIHVMPSDEHRKQHETFAEENGAETWEGEIEMQPVEFTIIPPSSADDLRLYDEVLKAHKAKTDESEGEDPPELEITPDEACSVLFKIWREKGIQLLPESKVWDYRFIKANLRYGDSPYKSIFNDKIPFNAYIFDRTLNIHERNFPQADKQFVEYFQDMKQRQGNNETFKNIIKHMEWLEVLTLYKLVRIEEAEALQKKIMESYPDEYFGFEQKYLEYYEGQAKKKRRTREFYAARKKEKEKEDPWAWLDEDEPDTVAETVTDEKEPVPPNTEEIAVQKQEYGYLFYILVISLSAALLGVVAVIMHKRRKFS